MNQQINNGVIMSRQRMKKPRPFEKLLIILLDGKEKTKEEIAELLGWQAERGSNVKGPKIYNISSYVWDIKNIPVTDNGASIVVRSIRDGKRVTAYQLANEQTIADATKYLQERGLIDKPKKQEAATIKEEAATTE